MPDNTATEKKKSGKAGVKRPVKKRSAAKKKQGEIAKKSHNAPDGPENSLSFTLDSVLTINKANELHSQYAAVLRNKCDVLTIDASSVQMIDTAIIQLLYSLIATLRDNGASIHWLSPSPEFSSRILSLGMAKEFCLADVKSD